MRRVRRPRRHIARNVVLSRRHDALSSVPRRAVRAGDARREVPRVEHRRGARSLLPRKPPASSGCAPSPRSRVASPLAIMRDLGVGYLKIGQGSHTLSGGEAQRLKLAAELSGSPRTRSTLYVLDEPTTGLHWADVTKLIRVLDRLVQRGDTLVVIEHHPGVMAAADHLIELGPEGVAVVVVSSRRVRRKKWRRSRRPRGSSSASFSERRRRGEPHEKRVRSSRPGRSGERDSSYVRTLRHDADGSPDRARKILGAHTAAGTCFVFAGFLQPFRNSSVEKRGARKRLERLASAESLTACAGVQSPRNLHRRTMPFFAHLGRVLST